MIEKLNPTSNLLDFAFTLFHLGGGVPKLPLSAEMYGENSYISGTETPKVGLKLKIFAIKIFDSNGTYNDTLTMNPSNLLLSCVNRPQR